MPSSGNGWWRITWGAVWVECKAWLKLKADLSVNDLADQGTQELTPAQETDAFPRELNLGLGGKLSKNKDSVENTEEKLGELDDRSHSI